MEKEAKFGKCALCLEEKELCKSHIIPKFTRKSFGNNNDSRLLELTSSTYKNEYQKRTIQDMPKEYLLCKNCEDIFGKTEKYFKEFHFDKTFDKTETDEFIYVTDIDNISIKHFALSLIWRFSISRAYFKDINLGMYEDKIKELLINDALIEPFKYPIFLYILEDKNHKYDLINFSALIFNPKKVLVNGFTTYEFIMFGFLWVIFITEKEDLVKKFYPITSLSEDKCLRIFKKDSLVDKYAIELFDYIKHYKK